MFSGETAGLTELVAVSMAGVERASLVSYGTTVRSKASLAGVWAEIGDLEQIFQLSPEFGSAHRIGESKEWTVQLRFNWGPIRRLVDAVARVDYAESPNRLDWSIDVPAFDIHGTLSFKLAAVAETETVVRYDGEMTCGHRLFSKLRGMLTDQAEDHVRLLAERVATLAAQHRESAERLHGRTAPTQHE